METPDVQEGAKITSVATIAAGVREVKVRVLEIPMGNQAQSLKVWCGALWPGVEQGPIMAACWGREGGRTPFDNQGHTFASECFQINFFVRFG
jgi:hypothetical protein